MGLGWGYVLSLREHLVDAVEEGHHHPLLAVDDAVHLVLRDDVAQAQLRRPTHNEYSVRGLRGGVQVP